MVQEAAANAEADKKRKEEADTINEASQLIFQVEKTVNDLKDVTEDEKNQINAAKDELQKAIDSKDVEQIKAKKQALEQAAQGVAQRAYQQAQGQAQGGASQSSDKKDDNTVDADFSDVN